MKFGGPQLFPVAEAGIFGCCRMGAFRWMLGRVNEQDGQPGLFYFHPWEVDPGQPRVTDAPLKSRFRHYLNLDIDASRLERLLSDFRVGTHG